MSSLLIKNSSSSPAVGRKEGILKGRSPLSRGSEGQPPPASPTSHRRAGVLLPLSALPSRHGVGDMGAFAMRFVDLLRQANVSCWQILPIHPLGYGNSPYQPYSSIAGDPLFISLDALVAEGLLPEAEEFQPCAVSVDYEATRRYKEKALQKAFRAFVPTPAYEAFAERPWVRPFAVFMAFKKANQMRCWIDWPEAQKSWPGEKGVDLIPFEEQIRFQMFAQFLFFTQWTALKSYANERGVKIIGDMPIYVGLDSVDVWANRESFLLDSDGQPTFIAGVPPDYFTKTGQRWGNPLYDWDFLRRNGFRFWMDRLRGVSELFDIIRIDHFRGFDTYWKIPADCPTAERGEWVEAPGYDLFDTIYQEMPGINLIAEDLGQLRDEVYTLRDHYALPGMKVLQFTFAPGKKLAPKRWDKSVAGIENSPSDRPISETHGDTFSPPPTSAAGDSRMVVYTGTHDNQTTTGWYRSMSIKKRLLTQKSLLMGGYGFGRVSKRLVRLALDDVAELAVIPAQDLLGASDEARINTPGTVGPPNWEWKLADFDGMEKGLRFFQRVVQKSGRGQ